MGENILSIKQYLAKGVFVIPNYQRGYKWGVPNTDGSCAVSILMDSLLQAFESPEIDYFIQGVTVYERDNDVYLVDGQQRTTTFFLLLKYLRYDSLPCINYSIREESHYVLQNSVVENGRLRYSKEDGKDYELQDIYYFEKAISTIHKQLGSQKELDKFTEFTLNRVKLFYITIVETQASKVFTMLNGNKAFMRAEELIKAKILSQASNAQPTFKTPNTNETEAEISTLRSKYAREWDKWIYWWNEPDVVSFFKIRKIPMGLLLEYFYEQGEENKVKYSNEPKDIASTYKAFTRRFIRNNCDAKDSWKKIRDFQKRFEDCYNFYESYNYLGLILNSGKDKKQPLIHFLTIKKDDIHQALRTYAIYSLIGANHSQIVTTTKVEGQGEETKEDMATAVFKNLSQKDVYGSHHSDALKQLLRRNVKLDNLLMRKFDFKIFGEKSLEHICPKSWENEEDTRLNFNKDGLNYHKLKKESLSVHSIGNIVLLDRNTNSSFQDDKFDEKKVRYFSSHNIKWSLKLLHSVAVFCRNDWNEQSIIDNQSEFINEFKSTYNVSD